MGLAADVPMDFPASYCSSQYERKCQKPDLYVDGSGYGFVWITAEPSWSVIALPGRPVDVSSILHQIKLVFALSDEELSRVLKVTRQTISNWRQRSVVARSGKAEKLAKLGLLAKSWIAFGGNAIAKSELRTPVYKGKSILELLETESIDVDKLAFIQARMELMSGPSEGLL